MGKVPEEKAEQCWLSIASERELAGIALDLAGEADLCLPERELSRTALRVFDRTLAQRIERAIAIGEDPLGMAFCRLRSQTERRSLGAVYTPREIIAPMTAWAASEGEPDRVVDVGAGSGRFILAAAEQFPNARLVCVELDPFAALLLRANLAVRGLTNRTQIAVCDFRDLVLPSIGGRTLFIGNPPYVRHHNVGTEWKNWFAASAKRIGIRASKLAGLHIHFFFKTAELAREGDFGAFVTSAEWLDVNYGSALRKLLEGALGGAALHVLHPSAMPFANAATTGAITCFQVGRRPNTLRVRAVPSIDQLNGLTLGTPVPWALVAKSNRWSTILRPGAAVPAGYIELGELCRVSRGQVTGSNAIWIEGPHTKDLPTALLLPTVTRARELLAAGDALSDASRLRRVVSLPVDLNELGDPDRTSVDRFIEWAEQHGAADSYVAKHRKAWWAVSLYNPAPIICTYMARRPPAFVRNLCNARHLNIAHGIYPREPLDAAAESGLLTYLRHHVTTTEGRTYAGGLTKFEPGEVERIRVPSLETLRHEATADLDRTYSKS